MDMSVTISLLAIFSLLEGGIIVGCIYVIRKIMFTLKQQESDRRLELKRKLRRGIQVEARVNEVLTRGRMQYELKAKWYGIESGSTYTFSETFWYFRGFLGMRPKIAVGNDIIVTVVFRPTLIYLMERPW